MMVKYQTVKIWDKFDINGMGDYHDHYLKKRCIVISRCF